ncbi:conserved hypothetical protein [Paecilomyces variotii No. 5]|uniref:Mono-functional DNA-alkylating methyl methanesulfonate N-term-domain-containing protein n=1 Tax=Byssochlamys spectabilis (strain No. 5 / NBRC 109023) TaxID=1356009 RepID=V5F9E3_BYSSN|nr:conserved hypothetical protein [Paecilomyces variotii No. 5]
MENGVWTTRRIDISDLLTQTRARRPDLRQDAEPPKPKVGLLSQTVIRSPIVQWILPARLRSKFHNDVAFVGERSVHLKEAVLGVHLEDVTTKADFDSNIVAAKVINTCTELTWEAQMKMGAGNVTSQDADIHDLLPPQILVLALESRELVFLYCAVKSPVKNPHFIHFRRPLPCDVSSLERFGRHVATDPRSRAMAVAASADYFGVFALRPSDVMQSQMTRGDLDPISEERFFRVDGDILFMDFLYPKAEDDDRIILLLLVSKNQSTQAVCYDWEATGSLRQARPRVTTRSLPAEDRLPTILVPLTKATSFMLITTVSMAVYRNILDARADKQPHRYPLPRPDQELRRCPLWTRWARPFRNWLYNQKHDDIYLCREDGKIFYLEIGKDGEIEHQSHLGQLGCDVDAAFDILDIGFQGGDLLLVAGNMGDGGLFIQKAREHPTCVQKFLNWAPVIDSVIVDTTSSGIGRNRHASSKGNLPEERLFACSGSTVGQGAVIELRHGIEARIGLVIPLEHLSGTRDIWTMTDDVEGGTYLLASDPVSSTLLYLPTDTGEEIYAMDDTQSGLDFSAHTLAGGCTPSGVIIQVTDHSINLTSPRTGLLDHCFRYEEHECVISAAVSGRLSLIVAAVRTHDKVFVYLGKALSSGDALAIEQSLGPYSLLFVGTANGKVLVYRVEGDRVVLYYEHDLVLTEETESSKAIENLVVVCSNVDHKEARSTLLCGLRSGVLVPLEMYLGGGNLEKIVVEQIHSQKLGQTTVRLSSNPTQENFALVVCGDKFWRLTHANDGDYTLQKIWVTDQSNPSYLQGSIDVTTLIDAQADPRPDSLSGSLVCVSEGQLLICTLDKTAGPVPRRVHLPGSANRLIYSKYLSSLVVSYTLVELDTESEPIKRYSRPTIEFIDLNSQNPEVRNPGSALRDLDAGQPWRPLGASGEKITCLLDWIPKRDGAEYHFIVIGTARKHQEEKGRIIFLQTQRDRATGHIECVIKHVHKFEGAVHAIAPYGDFTLMVATGYDIVPLEPKFSEKRWVRSARYRLTSPAVSISVHEPFLYLSTSRESLVVLKIADDKLVLHSHDRVKREGLSHFHAGGDARLTLATSRGGTVSALSEIGVTATDKVMPAPLAEAHLPLSIMKLNPSHTASSSSSATVTYGTALDGTVYRLTTLTEKEWRLLRFLQNMCMRDPIICPFGSVRKRRWIPAEIEPSTAKPSSMHVDGDILHRLLNYGSEYLRQMLSIEYESSSTGNEAISTGIAIERLSELSVEVFGDSRDPIKNVMEWLRKILEIGL